MDELPVEWIEEAFGWLEYFGFDRVELQMARRVLLGSRVEGVRGNG